MALAIRSATLQRASAAAIAVATLLLVPGAGAADEGVDAVSGSAELSPAVSAPPASGDAQDTGASPASAPASPTLPPTLALTGNLRGSLIATDPRLGDDAHAGFFSAPVPRLSFDDVARVDLAYRRSLVGRVLASLPAGDTSFDGGLLLELDLDGVVRDRGSFFRVEHDLGPARAAFVAFPLTSDRTRLGYSHLVSAGASELLGADAPRAAQVELLADEGYAFISGSAATSVTVRGFDDEVTEHSLWLVLAGFGASLFPGVGFEVQGAYGNHFTDVDLIGGPADASLTDLQDGGGVAARLSFTDGLRVDRPVDYLPLERDLFVDDSLARREPCVDLCFAFEGELLWLWQPHLVYQPEAVVPLFEPVWSGAFAMTARLATPTFEARLGGAMRELSRLFPAALSQLAEAAVDEQSELRVFLVVGSPLPEQGVAWRVALGLLDPAHLQNDDAEERLAYIDGEPVVLDAGVGGFILDAKASLLLAVADHVVFAVEPFVRHDPNQPSRALEVPRSARREWTVGANVLARALF